MLGTLFKRNFRRRRRRRWRRRRRRKKKIMSFIFSQVCLNRMTYWSQDLIHVGKCQRWRQ